MSNLEAFQVAAMHLSLALRLLDRLGINVAGAHVDLALDELRKEAQRQPRSSSLMDYANVDFTLLEAQAVRAIEAARTHSDKAQRF